MTGFGFAFGARRRATVAPPVLTSADYSVVDPSGGDTVTVTGSGITPSTVAVVDGSPATTTYIDATHCAFVVPAHAASSVSFHLHDTGGDSGSLGLLYYSPFTSLTWAHALYSPDTLGGTAPHNYPRNHVTPSSLQLYANTTAWGTQTIGGRQFYVPPAEQSNNTAYSQTYKSNAGAFASTSDCLGGSIGTSYTFSWLGKLPAGQTTGMSDALNNPCMLWGSASLKIWIGLSGTANAFRVQHASGATASLVLASATGALTSLQARIDGTGSIQLRENGGAWSGAVTISIMSTSDTWLYAYGIPNATTTLGWGGGRLGFHGIVASRLGDSDADNVNNWMRSRFAA